MLCRKVFVAFLTLALSSSVVQALPQPEGLLDFHRGGHHRPPHRPGNKTGTKTATPPAASLVNKGSPTTTTAAAGSTSTNVPPANNTNNAAPANNTSNAAPANDDPQTSLTLDPKVIAKGFENDGQATPSPGQVPSLTSKNNFINFCLTVGNLPITNGAQVSTGSCNPAPMGVIPSVNNMPSAKFAFPQNFGTIKSNTPFTIKLAIQGMETGNFVNAQQNYFAAPQQLNGQGQVKGHSHVVVEQLTDFAQTAPTDPRKFAFFKGLNGAAQGGILSADVTAGLPAGIYKVSSINTAANHQPILVPVAQHGSLDDVVYFAVTDDGKPAAGTPGGNSGSSGSATSSPATDGGATATPSPPPAKDAGATASPSPPPAKDAGATATPSPSPAKDAGATASPPPAEATATPSPSPPPAKATATPSPSPAKDGGAAKATPSPAPPAKKGGKKND